ncbi:MAG TPA: isoprenylcysteine carboxylmethyltransferase family protein, partial [Ramlibacter sp.]|nr:isoprenylcysteine carboxylmethyltransferase family protein [Ramlibacter sp.]
LYSVQPPFAYIMVLGQIAAVTGLLVAVWQTDALGLLGLRQLMGQKENTAFVTGGLYRYVRHPMYFFGLLILWLTPLMTVNVLAAWLGLSVYVLVGAHYEEKKLSRLYGSAYEEYRARTPMIVPLPRLGHKPT